MTWDEYVAECHAENALYGPDAPTARPDGDESF